MEGVTTEPLPRGGVRLALHTWDCPEASAAVFYVHGTQSHAGWLLETGRVLARAGVRVHALDRRGSGHSDGVRGDAASYRDWLDDYLAALARVRRRAAGLPLTILGQSLGGCIAAACAIEAPELHDALLLSGPAFDLLHEKLPTDKQTTIRRDRSAEHYAVRVSDEQYTHDRERLAFMAADERMTRALTGRFLAAQLDLEERLRALPAGSLPRPAGLLVAREDTIVRVPTVRDRFLALAPQGTVTELPGDEHYLEYSAARAEWWSLATSFALSGGARLRSAET
jgi:alpha-beta hydrolase superfamily lysophospholipase